MRKQARAQGIGEREVFDADARGFEWDTLEAAFNAPSLFSPRRMVEVRIPSGKPGKEGAEAISNFCANPPTDVILLVTGKAAVPVGAETATIVTGGNIDLPKLKELL